MRAPDAPTPAGSRHWGGIVGVYMSQAGGPTRGAYRRLVKQLVYQAIAD